MMLTAELALAEVDVAVVERRPDHVLVGSRAGGFHSRTRSNLTAEVETTEEPPRGIRHDATGVHALHPMEDGRTVRVVVTEQQLGPGSEPTLRDLSKALITVYGTDFGIHNPTWISRFTDVTRQAAAYRAGRVLLAAVVREFQPEQWGWTPHHGLLEVRARMDLSPRSMAAAWMVGLEDEPTGCGEICIFEVFGDALGAEGGKPTAAVGMGVHPFRDPALADEFETPRLASTWRSHTSTRRTGDPGGWTSSSTVSSSRATTRRRTTPCR